MKRSYFIFGGGAAFVVLAGLGVWAHGGELNPPAGPVAPTMKSLADISADIAAIGGGVGGGSIKRVVRGVLTYTPQSSQQSQQFSPAVDPAKSVVVLSPAIYTSYTGTPLLMNQRCGACVISLTASNITVAVDAHENLSQQVGYQIIEYN